MRTQNTQPCLQPSTHTRCPGTFLKKQIASLWESSIQPRTKALIVCVGGRREGPAASAPAATAASASAATATAAPSRGRKPHAYGHARVCPCQASPAQAQLSGVHQQRCCRPLRQRQASQLRVGRRDARAREDDPLSPTLSPRGCPPCSRCESLLCPLPGVGMSLCFLRDRDSSSRATGLNSDVAEHPWPPAHCGRASPAPAHCPLNADYSCNYLMIA